MKHSAVQTKVKVAISGKMPGIEGLKITSVRVFDRTYPAESKVLGEKKKGKHRAHAIGWDFEKWRWETKYIGATLAHMAGDLGCAAAIDAVEKAYGAHIDADARKAVLYWGDGKENTSAGGGYPAKRRKYLVSKRAKDDKASKGIALSEAERKAHLEAKVTFARSTLAFPDRAEVPMSDTERSELKKGLKRKRLEMMTTLAETGSEGLSTSDSSYTSGSSHEAHSSGSGSSTDEAGPMTDIE